MPKQRVVFQWFTVKVLYLQVTMLKLTKDLQCKQRSRKTTDQQQSHLETQHLQKKKNKNEGLREKNHSHRIENPPESWILCHAYKEVKALQKACHYHGVKFVVLTIVFLAKKPVKSKFKACRRELAFCLTSYSVPQSKTEWASKAVFTVRSQLAHRKNDPKLTT